MQGVSIFRKSIFKYKVTYLMQTDSKFAICFLSFDMYVNVKSVEQIGVCVWGGGGGVFNYVYKLFNVYCASNPFVSCLLTI